MSKPLTPYDRWLSGTNQNSIPANDNSLRDEIFNTDGIADDVTSQPGSPADGDWYIIPPGATGTQWATFAEDSVAIFYGGTWYEFVPAEGNIVTVDGDFYIYGGSGGWQVVTIPTSSPADEVSYDNTGSGLTATDVQAAIDEIAAGGGGSGDVTGPASSVAGNLALFTDTTGKEIEDGGTPGGMAFIDDAPSNGTGYVRKDGAWAAESGAGGATAYTIVTEASAFTADPGTHDGLFRYIRAGGNVTFDNAEPYTAGMVFNIRATAGIELVEDGVTLTPPAGGTLELSSGMAVQVVMTSATSGDVIGQTVAA